MNVEITDNTECANQNILNIVVFSFLKYNWAASLGQWLACSPQVWYIVGLRSDWVQQEFAAFPLCMHHKGVRSKTGWVGFRKMCPS